MEENRNITPAEYTDKDMEVVARLAYIDFADEMIKDEKTKKPRSLGDILNNPTWHKIISEQLLKGDRPPESEPLKLAKYEDNVAFLESLQNEYGDWKIVDVANYNVDEGDANGFCAITIETDANSAIVGFRGSEGIEDIRSKLFRDDWIMADVGLLNSVCTSQHASATEYMNHLKKKFNYLDYVTCGHSLGGNLATHALLTAPDGMEVVSGYSLDGPGYSDEYLSQFSEEIEERGSKINHYQWSLVGGLLNNIGTENNKYIELRSEAYGESIVERHDLFYMQFDDNNSVQPGSTTGFDYFAINLLDDLTAGIDILDSTFRQIALHIPVLRIVTFVEPIYRYIQTQNLWGKDAANRELMSWTGETFGVVIGGALGAALVAALGISTGGIAAAAIIVSCGFLCGEAGEFLAQKLYDLAENVVEGLTDFCCWVGDVFSGEIIYGTFFSEILEGDHRDNQIHCMGGDDFAYGYDGNDLIYGDDGDDVLYGGKDYDEIYGGNGDDLIYGEDGYDKLYGDDGNDTLYGGNDDDELYGEAGADSLYGDDGHDKLYGGIGDDTLRGGAGNDELYGEDGDDILYGGEGVDKLFGGAGNDTYFYGKGYGNDIILDGSGKNKIKFTNLMPEDMTVYYPSFNNNAVLTITETGETLTIKDFRSSLSWRNFVLEFGNGTTMKLDDEGSPFLNVVGKETDETIVVFYPNSTARALGGDDIINGSNGNNTIYGGEGDDTLNSNNGDDYLDGGLGNDTLYGGAGDDTYVFGKGLGNNVISDSQGANRIKFTNLSPEDMTLYYPPSNNDVVLTITETGETLTIKNFRSGTYWRDFTLEFSDGRTGKIDFQTATFIVDEVDNEEHPLETEKIFVFSGDGSGVIFDEELAQANADILDEIYANEDSMSDLLTESDNTVIPEITDSASAADEEENTNDLIDVQVMILTENMVAFSNESNISDSLNMRNNADDFAFANQLLVGTQAL